MAWKIEYAESVQKSVRKLDPQTRERIRSYLESHVAVLEDVRSVGKALNGQHAASGATRSETIA